MKSHSQRVRTTAFFAGIFSVLTVQAAEHTGAITSPAAPIVLRDVAFDTNSGLVTLRWISEAGKTYAIEETANPELGWEQNATDIPGGSPETIWTVPPLPANEGAKSMLFRVRELGGSDEVDASGEDALNPTASEQSSASLSLPRKGSAEQGADREVTSATSEPPTRSNPYTDLVVLLDPPSS